MSDSDSDEDKLIDSILEKMKSVKDKPKVKEPEKPIEQPKTEPEKKKRKPRGPASEATKVALAEGRKRRDANTALRKLEKENKAIENKTKIAELKKKLGKDEQPKPEPQTGGNDELAQLRKEMAELKAAKAVPEPVKQVVQQQVQMVDPRQAEYLRRLKMYCKY